MGRVGKARERYPLICFCTLLFFSFSPSIINTTYEHQLYHIHLHLHQEYLHQHPHSQPLQRCIIRILGIEPHRSRTHPVAYFKRCPSFCFVKVHSSGFVLATVLRSSKSQCRLRVEGRWKVSNSSQTANTKGLEAGLMSDSLSHHAKRLQ